LRTWRRLSPAERRLTLAAAGLLPVCALALRLAGLRRAYGWLAGRLPTAPAAHPPTEPERVARAVDRAAGHLPRHASCLVRSLVLWYLLARRGQASELVIGVRRPGRALEAHAWVEVDGRPVNDHPDVRERFVAFESPVAATVPP
jgi:hypothetical protein